MPELPEVEIVARRLRRAATGSEVASAAAPGLMTMKTVDPPLEALAGELVADVRRVGKLLVVDAGGLSLVVHLMSAGYVSLDAAARDAGPPPARDRSTRLTVRLADGQRIRLRERGTRQRAWAKLLATSEVEADEAVATLGPEAWPALDPETFAALVDQPRHLHPLLRHQRTVAGIGRAWVDEILWRARLSPFRQGSELEAEEVAALRTAIVTTMDDAIAHYERVVPDAPPARLPKPLQVHDRQGEPCPRCQTTLEAVFFSDHVMTYCPAEQTGGRVLKDRRLSRLLK